MKLFENKVGRPTNEIIKKRKSFMYMVAFLIMATVTAGSIILTSSAGNKKIKDFNKLGANVTTDKLDTALNTISNNIEFSYEIKQNGKDLKKVPNEKNSYITDSLASYEIDYNIKNNNSKSIYYILETQKGVNETGSSIELNNYGGVLAGNTRNAKPDVIFIPETDYIGLNTVYFNFKFFESKTDYEKYIKDKSTANKALPKDIQIKVLYSENFVYVDNYANPLANGNEKAISSNYTVSNYEVNKFQSLEITHRLYNYSNTNYYYRWFTYKDDGISKSKLNYVGDCYSLKSMTLKVSKPTLKVSSSHPKRAGVMKIYNSIKKNCTNDKYGTSNEGVIARRDTIVKFKNSVTKNNITININDMTINSVKFTVSTKNKKIKYCKLYKNNNDKYKEVSKFPSNSASYKNKNKITLSRTNLTKNSEYKITCTASDDKTSSLIFETLN